MFGPLALTVTRWTLRFDGLPPELTPERLRGAALLRYRRMVCPRSRWFTHCEACELLSDCSYGQVFAARPPDLTVLRKNRTLPRPYLFRPDPHRRDTFTLVLIGAAHTLLPRFFRIFERLGERGLGPGTPTFRIASVEVLSPSGTAPLAPGSVPQLVPLSSWLDSARPRHTTDVHFLTPTSVRDAGRWLRHPLPGPVLRRLRDRLSALAATWCGEAPPWDYRGLGELADRARLVEDRTRWVPHRRRSGSTGHVYPTSGFVGSARWSGVHRDLWPLLAAGTLLGVGRHCAFGNGWYTTPGAPTLTPSATTPGP